MCCRARKRAATLIAEKAILVRVGGDGLTRKVTDVVNERRI
jgi:hypothetical protein